MAQTTKFVDLTRTYIPIDPNSFPDSLHVVDMKEENRIPVMAYDGKNFLPTAYGYRSFFGTEKTLNVAALAERVDWVLLFQNEAMNNFVIALCDSGIWYKAGSTVGAWTQAVVLPHYRAEPLKHYQWTFTVLQNVLYCYRENGDHFYTIESQVPAPGILVTTKTPSFLNMAAQKGIFSAGNRLGFWDSANSTSWSTLDDKEDFTPDLETLAGNATFDQIVGRIISIRSHGDGFVIYATKSIIHVEKDSNSLYVFSPRAVLKDNGVAYPEQVVAAIPDTTHFAYTTMGLYKIESGNAEVIVPEITDFLKQTAGPKYLHLGEGRYLFVQMMGSDYTSGYPLQVEGQILGETITITSTDLADLYGKTQGSNPELTIGQFLQMVQQGVHIVKPSGGGGGPVEA